MGAMRMTIRAVGFISVFRNRKSLKDKRYRRYNIVNREKWRKKKQFGESCVRRE